MGELARREAIHRKKKCGGEDGDSGRVRGVVFTGLIEYDSKGHGIRQLRHPCGTLAYPACPLVVFS